MHMKQEYIISDLANAITEKEHLSQKSTFDK